MTEAALAVSVTLLAELSEHVPALRERLQAAQA
jgi:hypothetical protein